MANETVQIGIRVWPDDAERWQALVQTIGGNRADAFRAVLDAAQAAGLVVGDVERPAPLLARLEALEARVLALEAGGPVLTASTTAAPSTGKPGGAAGERAAMAETVARKEPRRRKPYPNGTRRPVQEGDLPGDALTTGDALGRELASRGLSVADLAAQLELHPNGIRRAIKRGGPLPLPLARAVYEAQLHRWNPAAHMHEQIEAMRAAPLLRPKPPAEPA